MHGVINNTLSLLSDFKKRDIEGIESTAQNVINLYGKPKIIYHCEKTSLNLETVHKLLKNLLHGLHDKEKGLE
ncbi:hypothetical protein ANAPH2_01371 [Anaplasma phagocytophilum]|nr:hypothetical protein ANAPH2_01371 [Anaplasma phagocytophilum]